MKIYKQLLFLTLFLFITSCAQFTCVPESPVTSVDGVSIDFEIQGEGSPTLVFVHGWSCDKTYWSDQVSFFSKRFKTVTIDLPGHGKSGVNRTDWTIEKFGQDVATVVNKLKLKKVILVGHSMGGPIIVEAAQRVPKRTIGIVAVDSGALKDPTKDPSKKSVDGIVANLSRNFSGTMQAIVKKYIFLPTSDKRIVQKVASDMAAQPPEIGVEVMKGLRAWEMGDDLASIKRVQAPVLFINAKRTMPNVELYKKIADFRYRLIPNVGHFVMLEDPKTFNEILLHEIDEFVK